MWFRFGASVWDFGIGTRGLGLVVGVGLTISCENRRLKHDQLCRTQGGGGQGSGFRVQGSGLRVHGLDIRVLFPYVASISTNPSSSSAVHAGFRLEMAWVWTTAVPKIRRYVAPVVERLISEYIIHESPFRQSGTARRDRIEGSWILHHSTLGLREMKKKYFAPHVEGRRHEGGARGSGFRVQGSGFRVQGSGCRVEG